MGAWLAAGRRAVAMASVSVLGAVGLVAVVVSDAAAATGAVGSAAARPELLRRLAQAMGKRPYFGNGPAPGTEIEYGRFWADAHV
jgi:hypothetical protein